jgi:hypothetical protein
MSCRPVQTVYISGMVLDADNSGQYMRAELYGADPVTHKGINLNSADRVDILSGQSLNMSSHGGLILTDLAPSGPVLNLSSGLAEIANGDGVHNSAVDVNPAEIDLTSLLMKLTGVVNVVGTLQVNGVPVTVP